MVKRIEQLDGLRALAIAAVFLHHTLKVKLLWMGVDLFFILSGFLITGILLNNKERSLSEYFGRFYRRRARRILPPYALLLFVTSLLFGLAWMRHWYCYVLLMNFLLAFHLPHPESLDILWSLAVEEQFYLFWPFAVYFLSERALVWMATAIFLLAPILRWFCTPLFPAHWAIYSLTPFRMDLLAVGALIAILWRRGSNGIKRYGHYGLVFSALALASLLAVSRISGFTTSANLPLPNVCIYELTLITCTGGMLWALSGRATGILTLSPVRYIGRISYTVYLIHLTIFIEIAHYLNGKLEIAGATLALTLLYAAVSWKLMEKPLLERKSAAMGAHSDQWRKLTPFIVRRSGKVSAKEKEYAS